MIIKKFPEDFIVEEITPEGLILEIDKKMPFKDGKGEYLIFFLQKTNWDTVGAAREITRRLGISRKRISFAGTKDKRAITTQRMSLWNVEKERLEKLRIKDMKIQPLYYSSSPLKLGDLKGNRFTITIRELGKPVTWKGGKFPNYFGVQRFGKTRPVTHLVGKALVENNPKKAVRLYLGKVFDSESSEAKEARKRLSKNWDYGKALKYFPKNLKYERTLLAYLAEHPNDYANSLRKLPRKLLIMFVHAYQSWIFNEILEKRTELVGFGPMEGDILEKGIPTALVPGYEAELARGVQGKIEEEILQKEWLSLRDFKIKIMPELSSRGLRRPTCTEASDFEILEQSKGMAKTRFSLPKGSYATTLLEHVCGNQ
jgi:tRNA pseudouridine13 synthase